RPLGYEPNEPPDCSTPRYDEILNILACPKYSVNPISLDPCGPDVPRGYSASLRCSTPRCDHSLSVHVNGCMKEYNLATSYSRRGKAPTTIGAGELNFRVRDGNGCNLSAIVTRLLCTCSVCTLKTK